MPTPDPSNLAFTSISGGSFSDPAPAETDAAEITRISGGAFTDPAPAEVVVPSSDAFVEG